MEGSKIDTESTDLWQKSKGSSIEKKNTIFLTNRTGTIGHPHAKWMNLDTHTLHKN